MRKMIVTATALILLGCIRTNAMLVKSKTLGIKNIIKETKRFETSLQILCATPPKNRITKYGRIDIGKEESEEYKLESPGTSYDVEHVLPNIEEPGNKRIRENIKSDPKLSLRKWQILTGETTYNYNVTISNFFLTTLLDLLNNYSPSDEQKRELNENLANIQPHLTKILEFPLLSSATEDQRDQIGTHNKLIKKIMTLKFCIPG